MLEVLREHIPQTHGAAQPCTPVEACMCKRCHLSVCTSWRCWPHRHMRFEGEKKFAADLLTFHLTGFILRAVVHYLFVYCLREQLVQPGAEPVRGVRPSVAIKERCHQTANIISFLARFDT